MGPREGKGFPAGAVHGANSPASVTVRSADPLVTERSAVKKTSEVCAAQTHGSRAGPCRLQQRVLTLQSTALRRFRAPAEKEQQSLGYLVTVLPKLPIMS